MAQIFNFVLYAFLPSLHDHISDKPTNDCLHETLTQHKTNLNIALPLRVEALQQFNLYFYVSRATVRRYDRIMWLFC